MVFWWYTEELVGHQKIICIPHASFYGSIKGMPSRAKPQLLTTGQFHFCQSSQNTGKMEKLVHAKILPNLLPQITYSQHSFIPGRSTITQLLTTFTQVNSHIDKGLRTDLIYFDLAKAFDKVHLVCK